MMDNEPPAILTQDDGRSKRGRLMGKLFGRDTRCSYDLVLVIYHKRVWPHRLAYSLHELTIALLSVPS